MVALSALTRYWRQSIVNNVEASVLLEACLKGQWRPIRITSKFSSLRAALNALPIFARQQGVNLDNVRARALRTDEQLTAAEYAVATFNAGDPGNYV